MIIPITHFQITKIPENTSVVTKVDNVPAYDGMIFPIEDQDKLTVKKADDLDNLSLSTFLKYKVLNLQENIFSNEAFIHLKWEDTSTVPASADSVTELYNEDVIYLLSTLPLNSAVEYIKIVSAVGIQSFGLALLFPGTTMTIAELYMLSYLVKKEGVGTPYFRMTYRVGRGNVLEDTIYSLSYNVTSTSKASLILKETNDTNPSTVETMRDYNGDEFLMIEEVTTLQIRFGASNGIAKLDFIFKGEFLNDDDFGSITIDLGNEKEVYNYTPETHLKTKYIDLDSNGQATFTVEATKVENVVKSGVFELDVTLSTINGTAIDISSNNNHSHQSLLGT